MFFPTAWSQGPIVADPWCFFCSVAGLLVAAPTGPTLLFGYDEDRPLDNPLSQFMYFSCR